MGWFPANWYSSLNPLHVVSPGLQPSRVARRHYCPRDMPLQDETSTWEFSAVSAAPGDEFRSSPGRAAAALMVKWVNFALIFHFFNI
jgi:hypothetical protein